MLEVLSQQKPHKAVESFEWTFLKGFDVLKLYLHRLTTDAAKVSGRFFGENCYCGVTLEAKKNLFFNLINSVFICGHVAL